MGKQKRSLVSLLVLLTLSVACAVGGGFLIGGLGKSGPAEVKAWTGFYDDGYLSYYIHDTWAEVLGPGMNWHYYTGAMYAYGPIDIPDVEPVYDVPVREIAEEAFNFNILGGSYAVDTATSISIGKNVTYIGPSAFGGCWNVETLNYNAIDCVADAGPNNYISFYGLGRDSSTGKLTINIGSNVEKIPDHFFPCNYLTSSDVPNLSVDFSMASSLTYIGANAFRDSKLSGTLNIPNTVTEILNSAFYNCAGINSLSLPSNISSIHVSAFSGCNLSGTIVIPASVTTFTPFAFANTNISRIWMDCTTVPMYTNVLASPPPFSDIVVPVGTKAAYDLSSNFGGLGYTSIIVEAVSSSNPDLTFSSSSGNWNYGGNNTITVGVASGRVITGTISTSPSYSVNQGTKQFTVNPLNQPIVVSATTGPASFTISYAGGTAPQGGGSVSGSRSPDTKTYGTPLTLPGSAVFTTTGWYQSGWATSNGGTQTHSLGGSYTTEAIQTFYPVWTRNTMTWNPTTSLPDGTSGASYSQTFAAATGTGQTFTYTVQPGTSATQLSNAGLTLTTSTRTISSSALATVASTTTYNFTLIATSSNGGTVSRNFSLTVLAYYTVNLNRGTLPTDGESFGGGGNSNGTNFTLQKQPGGAGNTLALSPYFTVTGYTQIGWITTNVSGGAIQGRTGTYSPVTSHTVDATATYYPVWQPATYTVTFSAGVVSYLNSSPTANLAGGLTKKHGSRGGDADATNLFTDSDVFMRPGMLQIGWATSDGATTITHDFASAYEANATVTLYPVWQIASGAVVLHNIGGLDYTTLGLAEVQTFDLSGGSVKSVTFTFSSVNAMNGLLPAASAVEFDGWYLANGTALTLSNSSNPTTSTFEFTWNLGADPIVHIYAKWVPAS